MAILLVMAASLDEIEYYFPDPLCDEALSPAKMRRLKLREGVQFYKLTKEFTYNSPTKGVIVVPVNFLTDYASIPRLAQALIDDDDPTVLYPAIIHDWGYATKGAIWGNKYPPLNKKEVDGLLREGMELLDASWWKRTAVYQAVNWFGSAAWNNQNDPVLIS